jgi:hypothetical protein
MRQWILLLALLFPAPNAYCLTRQEAVQLSKSRIAGLLPHFAGLAYNCFLFEQDCRIEGNSQTATVKWLSEEISRAEPKISYDSGVDKFLIDGAVRIAKTGEKWGSPVIFNEDLLAQETTPGQFEAVGFFEILGVLVHEFSHHQEEPLQEVGLKPLEHHELDLIASHVVSYLKDRTRRLQLGPEEIPGLLPEDKVSILQIDIEWNNGIRNRWSNVFVDSRAETRELSRVLVAGLRCPRESTHGHVTFEGVPYFAAFRQVQAPAREIRGDAVYLSQEVGMASVLCVDKQMGVFHVFDGYKNGQLQLVLKRNSQNQYVMDEGATRFTATPPPDKDYRQSLGMGEKL